ncbi:MAG: DUF2442 domain-containing protein [Methylococcales bacterium]
MNYPKVLSVTANDDYSLLIQFSNNETRRYDVKPLLTNEPFTLLNNMAFFKAVKIEQGGFAVSWNEDIDISEYELWRNSK